jgi:hypothetical protein
MKQILFIALVPILVSCGEHPDFSIPFTNQTIFMSWNYIEIPKFTYKDNLTGKTYTFHGTSGDIISSPDDDSTYVIPYDYYDTISTTPSFVWKKTNAKHVMVAIFKERVSIDAVKQQIKNTNSIVWAWNTGMSAGQEGAISYNNGCNVIDGVIQYNKPPAHLENGSGYILTIWAWNENASKIAYSSREIPFLTEE